MPLAFSELRNKHSSATSFMVGSRPSADWFLAKSLRNLDKSNPAGDLSEFRAVISPGVSTNTGQTALTRIPFGPSSLQRLWVNPVTPNLVAE
jgi:hypothetical protein